MAGARMGGAFGRIHRLFVEGTVAGLSDGQLLERFLEGGNEAAFAALVERHGPMVLAVCRSVLGHPEDAEDAFQATFLVLVGKGRTIRGERTLAGWLRQVAHRVAVRAGVESARRRACERRAAARGERRPHDDPPEDWRLALHEELARLSDRYRLPLLLCDLEGRTHAEAAAELGCGPATVQRRLAGARELLRSRLTRRGIAPAAGALAAALGRPAAASVPPDWVDAAVASARSFTSSAARLALGQIGAPTAGAIARKCIRDMLLGRLARLAVLSVALAALGGIAWGVRAAGPDEPGAARQGPTPPRPRPLMPAGSPKPAGPEKPFAGREAAVPETVAYRGLVVDPQGRPFAGAALHAVGERLEPSAYRTVRATSGPDGRFRFELPGKGFLLEPGQTRLGYVGVVARAPGLAFGLADGSDLSRELTVTLARDDAPILGRVVDLEGRPVAGASVKVMEVRLPDDGLSGDEVFARAVKLLNAVRPVYGPYAQSFQASVAEQLDAGLMDMEDSKEWATLESPSLPNRAGSEPAPLFLPDATAGPDGRFRITGIGRRRIATLQLDGPTIERTNFDVRTWPGGPIHVRQNQNPRFYGRWTVYGATFEHVAGPTRAIEGVVRDRETGRPLADILVYRPNPTALQGSAVRAITDAQGRYRLVGLPLGREGELMAIPACDLSAGSNWLRIDPRLPADRCPPYFQAEVTVPKSPGKEPVHLDIALDRGVRVTGRILDKSTGKPVRGRVAYLRFDDNPHSKGDPDPDRRRALNFTNVDGVFRLVIPPGPGVLAAYAYGPYIRAAGVESIKDRRPDWLAHIRGGLRFPAQFHALRWIEPTPGASSITRDLVVEPVAGRRPARPGL